MVQTLIELIYLENKQIEQVTVIQLRHVAELID